MQIQSRRYSPDGINIYIYFSPTYFCGALFFVGWIMKKLNTKRLVITALFCALAYVCVFVFRIKVSFLTFDAKDAIIAISSLLYGPITGVIVSSVVSLLEFLTVSDTGVYGLIMNILSTISFVLPASIIYKYRKTNLGAVLGLLTGVFCMTAVMLAANLLITPYYMGVDISVVKGLLPTLILPFNFTKSVLNAALTMLIYKPTVNALRVTKLVEHRECSQYKFNKTTVINVA